MSTPMTDLSDRKAARVGKIASESLRKVYRGQLVGCWSMPFGLRVEVVVGLVPLSDVLMLAGEISHVLGMPMPGKPRADKGIDPVTAWPQWRADFSPLVTGNAYLDLHLWPVLAAAPAARRHHPECHGYSVPTDPAKCGLCAWLNGDPHHEARRPDGDIGFCVGARRDCAYCSTRPERLSANAAAPGGVPGGNTHTDAGSPVYHTSAALETIEGGGHCSPTPLDGGEGPGGGTTLDGTQCPGQGAYAPSGGAGSELETPPPTGNDLELLYHPMTLTLSYGRRVLQILDESDSPLSAKAIKTAVYGEPGRGTSKVIKSTLTQGEADGLIQQNTDGPFPTWSLTQQALTEAAAWR